MSKNLYISAIEAGAGKSLVVLGIMEILSKNIPRLGFFRPVVRAGEEMDPHINLIASRYQLASKYESMYGVTDQEAREFLAKGKNGALHKRILSRYKDLERNCDFILCEGTDFTSQAAAYEFDFNAKLANNLGCPILIVLNGHQKSSRDILDNLGLARETFLAEGCSLVATVVNRIEEDEIPELSRVTRKQQTPVYFLPEVDFLDSPTMGEIEKALKAERLYGEDAALNHEVLSVKVAAMSLPNVLDHLKEGTLLITPGDRADIIAGSFLAHISSGYPKPAGLLLSGGLTPEPQIRRLIEGLSSLPMPVLQVMTDTYSTAKAVDAVRPVLTPQNQRKIATALGAFEARIPAEDLKQRIEVSRSEVVTPMMFEYELIARAKSDRRHIVLPEGSEDRILLAAEILLRRQVVDLTLLGNEEEIQKKIASRGLKLPGIRIIDPHNSPWHESFSKEFFELRKHKGLTETMARDIMNDVTYFGTMMVRMGEADGMVSGSTHTTQQTIRPAFQVVKTRPGVSIVSSIFLMCLEDRVLVYGDCAVNPNPNADQLADIAISSAETAKVFGIEPRVAMLSYSTGSSGKGEDVEKVRQATAIVREKCPDLKIEGPLQYDAAADIGVAKVKLPGSEVAGYANVYIFPDLDTGNNTYKAVQRTAHAVAIGPVLQGLNKPVNDLSRGATVTDIVNTVAITAIQAQGK